MEEIILNENVKITKERIIYKIEFRYTSYSLINSLLETNIIKGGSTDEKYKSIIFKVNSIKTLKQYQDELKVKNGKKNILTKDLGKMLQSLVIQLNYLIENESCTIIGYNPNEIIIINDEKSVFLGSELVANINSEGMTMISCPFSPTDFFISPELLKIRELPSFIHYKSSYFSLALLIIYYLLADNEFYKDYLNERHTKKIIDVLDNHPIKNTKIYWLLSRCLVEEAKNRSIILI